MKEDLVKILNFKLKQIKTNTDNLNHLNSKIEDEESELKYIEDAIEVFKGEKHGFDIYKFSNISRETFNKLLMNLSDEVLTKFGTNSCNYDGLIYLINGINSGISLTLTQEQTDAINLFIDKLLEKEKEEQDKIQELNDEKQKLEIKDLSVLSELDNKYSLIIDNIEDKKYVSEIDEIVEAINYSQISNENAFDILCYLLKYNSDIHKEKLASQEVEVEEEKIDLTKPFEVEDNYDEDDVSNEDNIGFKFDSNEESTEEESDIESEFDNDVDFDEEETKDNFDNEYNPVLPSIDNNDVLNQNIIGEIENQSVDMIMPGIELDLPVEDDYDDNIEFDVVNIPVEEYEKNLNEIEIENDIDNDVETPVDFEIEEKNIDIEDEEIDESVEIENELEENNVEYNDVSSNEKDLLNETDKVNQVFEEYNLNISSVDEISKNILLKGNSDEYRNILSKLNEYDLLKYLENDMDVLLQIIMYSSPKIIDEVMEILKNDLSVDNNDSSVTSEILIKTMPSVFVGGEKGNYNNFINNVLLFKKNGIDLINLYDFSREVFVADNSFIENNYKVVCSYDLTVNAYNAKYLLLLPNISSKIDYYVEAMYKDNSLNGNNELFDGLEMIKLYPNKLNSVTNKTIQRLRYSSEKGLKVFGSKEKSLAGEITNLNVDFVNMSKEYLDSLFNNEFDIISKDEVEDYIKLVNNNDYIELNEDELLSKLAGYKVGLRYLIGNINVSSNKVIRNYNILVNNGIDKLKALLFAISYNLTITKTEYERIKSFVNDMGGN